MLSVIDLGPEVEHCMVPRPKAKATTLTHKCQTSLKNCPWTRALTYLTIRHYGNADNDCTYNDFAYNDFTFSDFTYNDFNYNDLTYNDLTYNDLTYNDVTYNDNTYALNTGDIPYNDITWQHLKIYVCYLLL